MLPKVSIVGRPNVGKSSLLNLLAGRMISIVDPTAGVTRDRITADLQLPPERKGEEPRWAEITDTGGFGIYGNDERYASLRDDIEKQIKSAVDEAQLILFTIDAHDGILPLDEQVADLLRKRVDLSKVMLVANKVDSAKQEALALDATRLGFGDPVMVSATTGRGKHELLQIIADRLDFSAAAPAPKSEMLLAIVGKRNAGKSTLVNALAGFERVIASELPGTTRDSVDVKFEMDGKTFTAIDTAGVRKRKSLEDDIEYYSLHRSLRAIRRADVVVLLIDATEKVSQVDEKLGAEIVEHAKPCVVVINKWDLVPDDVDEEKYVKYLNKELKGLDFAPIAFISAKDAEGIRDVVHTALDLFEQAGRRVPTAELNRIVQDILTQRGPSPKLGQKAKIYYVTQPTVHPPSVALFVNNAELFDNTYQRYLLNQFRERLPFGEVPIRLLIRQRHRVDRHKTGEE
jgi:GTP-binding protein